VNFVAASLDRTHGNTDVRRVGVDRAVRLLQGHLHRFKGTNQIEDLKVVHPALKLEHEFQGPFARQHGPTSSAFSSGVSPLRPFAAFFAISAPDEPGAYPTLSDPATFCLVFVSRCGDADRYRRFTAAGTPATQGDFVQ
jgi:hypothetical protein